MSLGSKWFQSRGCLFNLNFSSKDDEKHWYSVRLCVLVLFRNAQAIVLVYSSVGSIIDSFGRKKEPRPVKWRLLITRRLR